MAVTFFYNVFLSVGHMLGCHQRPDRSFFFHGKQFPVCARCTGVFLGECVSLLSFRWIRPSPPLLLFFCGTMFLDWLIQALAIRESTNLRRLVTGLLGGYGYSTFVLHGLVWIRNLFSI